MPIVGHGVDLVETARIADMRDRHGGHFLDRVFTAREQEYCLRHARAAEHLSGRFAAKEAVLKAIGTGWRGEIAWTDIEILPDVAGRPVLTVAGQTAAMAQRLGITRWHVSITHTDSHAMASVIAEAD